jgi:hypothetical protein
MIASFLVNNSPIFVEIAPDLINYAAILVSVA